jgi:hypothetical protein
LLGHGRLVDGYRETYAYPSVLGELQEIILRGYLDRTSP